MVRGGAGAADQNGAKKKQRALKYSEEGDLLDRKRERCVDAVGGCESFGLQENRLWSAGSLQKKKKKTDLGRHFIFSLGDSVY